MKTLADFKREIMGKKLKRLSRFGKVETEDIVKTVTKVGNSFIELDKSRLDIPRANLLEYDGKTVKVFRSGFRELTKEEKEILENRPRDKEVEKIDLMTDSNMMFWRDKEYFKKSGKYYLMGIERVGGMYLTHKHGNPLIDDENIKGELILEYEIVG